MVSNYLVGKPVVISMKLIAAEQYLQTGRLSHALHSFTYVEDELTAHPERGPQDPVLLRAMLQTAQYGVAASLLLMRRIDEAKRAADRALADSFAPMEDDAPDRRRHFLTVLSVAKTREDYARAWALQLGEL